MRRGRFFFLLAILLILLAAGLFLITMIRGGAPAGKATPEVAEEVTPEVPTVPIVIALQNLPRGQSIPPEAVGIREWPEANVPPGALENVEDVIGKRAKRAISQGEPILEDMLTDIETIQETGSDASFAIPKGKVAVAFPIDRLSSVAYALQPGDRVDVLISWSFVDLDEQYQIKQPVQIVGGEECFEECRPSGEQRPRSVTQLTVQNALVLRVGPWRTGEQPVPEEGAEGEEAPPEEGTPAASQEPDIITLVVTPQDALVLKFVRENGARIDLALRSAENTEDDIFSTEAVTLEYMINRFKITIPPKKPYGLEKPQDLGVPEAMPEQ